MQFRSRALAIAALGVAPLLLVTACGGGGTAGGSTGNLTPITGSSYVTIQPATTTTTTTTIAPPVDELEAGQISPVEQLYTIQSGDSLSRIAGLYDIEMQTICTYNSWPDCIDPPHLLLPGDTVRIPPESLIPGTGTPGTPGGETPVADTGGGDTAAGAGCTHTIEAGENPTKVANKYDITYNQLQNANPGMDFTTTFIVGDVLTIPPEGDCG